jgi:hypothetical protein
MWTVATGFLAACDPVTDGTTAKTDGVKVLAGHKDGLGILDTATGQWLVPPGPAVAAPDHRQLAAVHGNQLDVWTLAGLNRASVTPLVGSWVPRAVAWDKVALVEGPSGNGIYQPAARSVTKIRFTGKEQILELPGNFEPEAFSADGQRLYLLDYLPPQKPELYRVRVLDLTTGQVLPLNTRDKQPIPPGAEETMRGQGHQAVFDPANGTLFTLYTHQEGHQHTGELLGVRPGSPDVHAFIHALHLELGWAYCIDLPKPFGESGTEGHTLALGAGQLFAISAAHGVVARISPESLNILSTRDFSPLTGAASAVATPAGKVFVAAGDKLTDTETVLPLDRTMHGLALAKDGRLWTSSDGKAVSIDWQAKKVISEISVPGLESLHAIVNG